MDYFNLPEVDLLPDELEAIKEAQEQIARGEVYTSAEVRAMLGLDHDE